MKKNEEDREASTILLVGMNINLAQFLECAGDVVQVDPRGVPPSDAFLSSCKGVVFGGGADIDPDLYDSEEGYHAKTFCGGVDRTLFEVDVFDACQRLQVPTVGICRGAQFLCAMSGGKVVQHTEGHTKPHKIDALDIETGAWQEQHSISSSTHHQMMMPFCMPEDEYLVVAKSSHRLSPIYHRGPKAERAYTDEDMHCEPEIVAFTKTNALAIQGHPEYGSSNSREFVLYCEDIINKHLEINRSK